MQIPSLSSERGTTSPATLSLTLRFYFAYRKEEHARSAAHERARGPSRASSMETDCGERFAESDGTSGK